MNVGVASTVAGRALHERLLDIEQSRLLYGSLATALAANLLAALLLSVALWGHVPQSLLLGWASLMLLVQLGRLGLLLLRRSNPATLEDQAADWLRRFRYGSLASGLAWGMAGVVLFPAHSEMLQLLVALVLVGVCAGAISSGATDRVTLIGFTVPALLPAAARYASHGGEVSVLVALMTVLFTGFVLVSTRRLQRQLMDNVQLRAEAIGREQMLRTEQRLNEVIGRVQSLFIRDSDRRHAFETLLDDVLQLTGSAYGFVAEVLRTPEGAPYLKSYAITNIAWDEPSRAFYEAAVVKGMEFRRLDTLFGAALTTGEPVIANDPATDPRRGGLPPGHPPLNAFLGLPIRHGGELIAMIGLANRPGGYDNDLIEFLHPLLATLGQLADAERSERRHRQDQLQLARLSRVASETTNGVVITDVQGRVEWINEGFTRITGYTLDDVLDKRPGSLLQGPQTDPGTVRQMREALAHEAPFELEVLNYTRDRRPYWIHISCNPLRDASGVLQGFIAIESDVTERKKLEGIKSEFVSTVSHELRTPLTAIAGSLGLLAGGALGPLPEQMAEMIHIAQKNSKRLATLINDLLDMEKLEAGQMRFELAPHPLQPLLQQSVQENQAYAEQHGVRIDLLEAPAQDLVVEVDPQRLLQVLANLLSNAAKFSPPGAVVEVALERRGDRVRVAVHDHGSGIPAEFQERMFEKFAQAEAGNTRRKGGTGLGLAISRELVNGMGGHIGFESVPGQGTTFHIELPLLTQDRNREGT